MLAQSQGRNEQVVNSYNLFIDSAKDVGGGAGKGDSFSLQLGADSIQAQDGQFLRLTLQEFSMYTNFYMVNFRRNTFPQEFGLLLDPQLQLSDLAIQSL